MSHICVCISVAPAWTDATALQAESQLAAAPSAMCPIVQKSSTLGEEVQAALTGSSIELTLAMEMKGGWVEMTVAAMYTAASSQAHGASKTCSAHQRPCITTKHVALMAGVYTGTFNHSDAAAVRDHQETRSHAGHRPS